jgi:hypothetical protein
MDLTLLHLAVPPRSTDPPPSPPRMGPGHRPGTRTHRCRRPAGHPHGAAAPEWTAASALGRPFSGPRSRCLHNNSRTLNARPHRTAGDRAGGLGAEPLPPRRPRLGGHPDQCEREGIEFLAWSPRGAGRPAETGRRALVEVARRHHAGPDRRGLAAGRSRVVLPIPGASRVSYLEENLAGAALRLHDEWGCRARCGTGRRRRRLPARPGTTPQRTEPAAEGPTSSRLP